MFAKRRSFDVDSTVLMNRTLIGESQKPLSGERRARMREDRLFDGDGNVYSRCASARFPVSLELF